MTRYELLILSVSADAGHVRAAEAIRAHAAASGRPVQAVHLDAMDFVTPAFRKLYRSSGSMQARC